jgi:hypothetical protein
MTQPIVLNYYMIINMNCPMCSEIHNIKGQDLRMTFTYRLSSSRTMIDSLSTITMTCDRTNRKFKFTCIDHDPYETQTFSITYGCDKHDNCHFQQITRDEFNIVNSRLFDDQDDRKVIYS